MNKSVVVFLGAIVLLAAGFFVFKNKASKPTESAPGASESSPAVSSASSGGTDSATPAAPPVAQDTGELQIFDLKTGTGDTAVAGKTVVVHYTGTLLDGTKFDSSLDRNQPFPFSLGGGQVIQGWDQGVAGMKVGGVRRLIIPAKLGYGEAGAGGVIPPNAALVFEVELLEVK